MSSGQLTVFEIELSMTSWAAACMRRCSAGVRVWAVTKLSAGGGASPCSRFQTVRA